MADTDIRVGGLGRIATIFACGAALFSDGYVNAASGPVNAILKRLYPTDYANHNSSQLFSSMVFAGTILGMLSFGYISDRVGRKVGMIFASLWLSLFSIMSGLAYGGGGSIGGLIAALIAYRFLIGIAIGAEYPAGSVAASENSEDSGVNKKRQHAYVVLSTNTMIDLGFVLSNFASYLLLQIFGENRLEWVWRLTLGLGTVFPLAVLFFRMQMREPEAYRKNSMKNIGFFQLPWRIILKHYWQRLFAISVAWFIYDWIAYPAGIYSSVIVAEAIPNGTLSQILGWDTLINFFYLPGTIFGALIIDRLGPKYTMILGLLCQSVVGIILSAAYEKIRTSIAGFAILYGIYLSFGEVGPGNCLGLLAAKASGPTCVRGIFYGAAAAIGKIGAFIATYVYTPIIDDVGGSGTYKGDTVPVWIGSGLALLSALVIFLFIPNFHADIIAEEDMKFRRYLEEAGYPTEQIGLTGLLAADDEKGMKMVDGSGTAIVEPVVPPKKHS